MRKLALGTMACALTLALGLVGCGGAPSTPAEDAPATDEQTTVEEEPAFNAEDFFGCWEYSYDDYWFYVYGDGTYEWFYDDGTTIIGHGEFYWSDDVERGQVYVESSNFEEEIMYLYLDSYENLIFDEGDGGTAYVLQPRML